jgi:hypothetical protein
MQYSLLPDICLFMCIKATSYVGVWNTDFVRTYPSATEWFHENLPYPSTDKNLGHKTVQGQCVHAVLTLAVGHLVPLAMEATQSSRICRQWDYNISFVSRSNLARESDMCYCWCRLIKSEYGVYVILGLKYFIYVVIYTPGARQRPRNKE